MTNNADLTPLKIPRLFAGLGLLLASACGGPNIHDDRPAPDGSPSDAQVGENGGYDAATDSGQDGSDQVTDRGLRCDYDGPCGDGVLDPYEECDDGNVDPSDGCSPHCVLEVEPPPPSGRCGDGVLETRSELCDDGNQRDGDGCDSNCLAMTLSADGGGSSDGGSPRCGMALWTYPLKTAMTGTPSLMMVAASTATLNRAEMEFTNAPVAKSATSTMTLSAEWIAHLCAVATECSTRRRSATTTTA